MTDWSRLRLDAEPGLFDGSHRPDNYCDRHNLCWTHEPQVCPGCDGEGENTEHVDDGCDIWIEMDRQCQDCGGSGHVHLRPDGNY